MWGYRKDELRRPDLQSTNPSLFVQTHQQVPSIPSKRKAPADPKEFYRSSKPRLDDSPVKAPPEQLPTPEDLEQEENEQDEEGGRFHGSGMSSHQREILSYLDREDVPVEGGEVIGREGFGERDVRKLTAALEKAIQVNEARRSKFADTPEKFFATMNND